MTDLVAVWEVALSDGVHKIEFEHGTTSGKRVVYVDGKVGKNVTLWNIVYTEKLDFANVYSSYVNTMLFLTVVISLYIGLYHFAIQSRLIIVMGFIDYNI